MLKVLYGNLDLKTVSLTGHKSASKKSGFKIATGGQQAFVF